MNKGIVLDNISKSFGGIQVLRNISVSITEGEITAFIGPNGAGKTTLFHLISGVLEPDTGTIVFQDHNITGLQAHAIARLGIGRQFQDLRIFKGLTVFENILVGMIPFKDQNIWSSLFGGRLNKDFRKSLTPDVMKWLEYVNLQDYCDHLGRELSFGQQKLLAFSRLLSKGFEFLLLDEPTAGLSHEMIETVINLIRQTVSEYGVTISFIEHNMGVVADLSTQIYLLREGQVAFSGKYEVLTDSQSAREMYIGI